MSLSRAEWKVQDFRNDFWVSLNAVDGDEQPVSLKQAKAFDQRLKGMGVMCGYPLDECISQLKVHLRYQKRQSPAWQINFIYYILLEKAVLNFSIAAFKKSNKSSNEIDAVIACRAELEEEITKQRYWQGNKDATDYAKYEAYYSLAESYIQLGAVNARTESRRVDMTHPEIKRGMVDYKNNLVLLSSLNQQLFAESGSYYEALRVLKFVEYLSLYLPEQATMADDDIQDFIKVIKDALDVCAAMPRNCVEPLEAIRLAKLSVARLYVNTPASKENNKSNAVQALYWFEEAKKSGAELSEEDENFINQNTTALKAAVDSVFNNLLSLVDYQRNQPKGSQNKKAIFSNLYNILVDHRVNDSNLNRIMKFKDTLEAADRTILLSHDKPAWRRFVENALSFIALLIPAIIRAHKSNAMYGTCRFWQPESKRALKAAENTINRLVYG